MYENWKILKTELEEKQEEYSAVAAWCNEGQQYRIEEQGDYYAVVKKPEPAPLTPEQAKALRATAYALEVDCITAHIQRLRDESPVPEGEIAELVAERDAKVAEIKERYPYEQNISD